MARFPCSYQIVELIHGKSTEAIRSTIAAKEMAQPNPIIDHRISYFLRASIFERNGVMGDFLFVSLSRVLGRCSPAYCSKKLWSSTWD